MNNHYRWAVCDSCVQRHCNKTPKLIKGKAFDQYTCTKYRKHVEGFKLKDVYREGTRA